MSVGLLEALTPPMYTVVSLSLGVAAVTGLASELECCKDDETGLKGVELDAQDGSTVFGALEAEELLVPLAAEKACGALAAPGTDEGCGAPKAEEGCCTSEVLEAVVLVAARVCCDAVAACLARSLR